MKIETQELVTTTKTITITPEEIKDLINNALISKGLTPLKEVTFIAEWNDYTDNHDFKGVYIVVSETAKNNQNVQEIDLAFKG